MKSFMTKSTHGCKAVPRPYTITQVMNQTLKDCRKTPVFLGSLDEEDWLLHVLVVLSKRPVDGLL